MASSHEDRDSDPNGFETKTRIPHRSMILDQGYCTPTVQSHPYHGRGTVDDPYVVTWLEDDTRNPMNWSIGRRVAITICISVSTFAGALSSSAYTGTVKQIVAEFGVVTLGLSFFVLGFAVGPLVFGPLSELYGRQWVFTLTYGALTVFNAGAAGANSIEALLVTRFFAGVFGSSPLTNAGGQISDMFGPDLLGLAMSLFIAAPFIGPTVGPIIGGFMSETIGWRWVEGFCAIFTGVQWFMGTAFIPETYAPVLLKRRAQRLSRLNGKVYKSKLEIERGTKSPKEIFGTALSRPWALLFWEPIVLLLSSYIAIVYGTLYMFFAAFPIVFQEKRGWSEGLGGLAFTGVAVGMLIGVIYAIPENMRYMKLVAKAGGKIVPPEQRLMPAMVAAPFIPIGLFWFAWTNYPSFPPYASIAAGTPFAFGMILIWLSIANYLVSAYTVYAASALAANCILRSLFGFAFPLFAQPMYRNLGIHWASSVPAFLALACVPFPYLLYKYGPAIRKKCKYAAEAERIREMVQKKDNHDDEEQDEMEKGGDGAFELRRVESGITPKAGI